MIDTTGFIFAKPTSQKKAKKRTYYNSTIPLSIKPRKLARKGIRRVKLKPSRVVKINLKKIRKETEDLAKLVAKERAGWVCQVCENGIKITGSNCHGSHIVPVSKGNSLRFNPLNILCFCYHHHINWWHKNPVEAGLWFAEKFPQLKIYLDERKNLKVKIAYEDYQRMIIELKKQLEELKLKNSP